MTAADQLAQYLASGLVVGGVYALIGLGFVIVYSVTRVINFAQGEFVMLPAFLMLAGMRLLGLSIYVSFALALALSALLLGWMFKRVLVDRMLPHGYLSLVIATIGLSLFMKESVKVTFGPEALPFPSALPEGLLHWGPVVVSQHDLGVLLVAALVVVALHVFLAGTVTGRSMQAVAQNAEAALVLGIPVARMVLYTFLINAVLVTLATLLVTPVYLAKYSNGESLGLVAFIAAIVGGFNRVRGALVGGLLLGVVDNLSGAYFSTAYRQLGPLVLLIVIILFRPHGLLGQAEERTV
jgi:branched-chain amino acid transport system permease protein